MRQMADFPSLRDVHDAHPHGGGFAKAPARARDGSAAGGTKAAGRIEFEVGTPLADLERRALLATLAYCEGNKRRCAELCGVSLKTLYNRLAAYRREAAGEPSR